MSATVELFVFRGSIPFCMNAGFLAISFSMIEITRWSVSMTSIISASDLLKFFASLASIEPVRRDLELTNVVYHCRNFVALLVSFTSARCLHVCGVRLPPASPSPA